MRDTRHGCVQPAAAFGFQERACGGEQPDGALRVVLLSGDGREALEVVGGACFVSGLGRQRQSLLQVASRSGQVRVALAVGCSGWLRGYPRSDAAVGLEEQGGDREGAFELAVAAFDDVLALVAAEDLLLAGRAGRQVGQQGIPAVGRGLAGRSRPGRSARTVPACRRRLR